VRTKIVAIIAIVATALLLAVPVAVGSEYIPESYTRSTNYYDVTGEPYLIATLVLRRLSGIASFIAARMRYSK
jgi:hypothetical protein